MIKIVDYGLGNVQAFVNTYKRLNITLSIAKNAGDLQDASKVILPGVGAFDHAMELLDRSGMRGALDELVVGKKTPVLGICVGMQILGRSSDEGSSAGLGWVGGEVKSLGGLRVDNLLLPHMGWNDIHAVRATPLLDELQTAARFYFLHSYYFRCDNRDDVAATCSYGADFCCALNAGNVYGVQFHPEKSHHFGVKLLKNFAEL
jgi:imidazole glycerol-phosphate synthase subunit HisH